MDGGAVIAAAFFASVMLVVCLGIIVIDTAVEVRKDVNR